jgi:hypothetical protein
MNIPPDDPNNPGAGLDPSLALKKPGSKVPMIVIGVAVVGIIGFFVVTSMKKQDQRKMHAALMEQFQAVEKDDLGKFWSCVLGPNVDPATFPDNLVLSSRITGQFGTDPKNYPTKVREDCTPKAIDAKHKIEGLQAPSEYQAPLKKYGDALKDMASAFDEWTKIAPAQVKDMEVGKKVDVAGAAWHSFAGGKPDNDVIAWDRFLHCAVPAVDTMKDGQALVEFLFAQCKNPAYVSKMNDECGKELVADPVGAPTKNLAATQKKLGADDRDLEAFGDCMRKGRKGKRRDDLADVGKAWVSWLEAGREVRKIGKEALKE